ncbi:DNA-binding transcriptional LysR family regulator [Parvibaculum indicum]|uniref:LysR family transcriptional regulator n=1 Tax=Parvibaculum indicum TaxID=562969 RepID=UPI001420860D|nr:LysR family transcriptional regulator [Parvibaculum indicum]NIJ42532.1 DNA-binding transcriptional LysR family regulator [Parvibaculum indicum]
MNKTEPGWEFYRSFLAVMREGSLSGAARLLGLTQPTVGRHIDALEDELGVSLFTRSQNGLSPTDSALSLMPHAEAMASAADALRRAATGAADEDRGTVRLTASEIIGTEVLPPMLTSFREKHPMIAVEMVISNRNTDLLRREADIAIRMAQPTQSALVARKVGTVHLGFHAHPAYIEKHGLPSTMEELSEHPVIGYDRNASIRRLDQVSVELTRDFFTYRCDSDVAQYGMLKAGFGIGVCQYPLGKRDGLVSFMPEAFDFPLDIWIVMHEDLRGNRRMRLMFDHLAETLGSYARSAGHPVA